MANLSDKIAPAGVVRPGDNISTLTNNSGYLTGITGQSIKNLSDVYSSMSPTDGQVLAYDTTNGWQAETAATVSTTYGDVGTYVYACTASYTTTITPGSTHAGSGLRPAGAVVLPTYTSYAWYYGSGVGSSLSGTWRAMGNYTRNGANSNYIPATVFVRIS